MPINGQRSKYWCATVNNYSPEEKENLNALQEDMQYLVVGYETGEAGTPHLQVYVEFKKRKTLTAVKQVPGFERAHLETRRGTSEEASDYSKKDGEFVEFGELSKSKQGKRSDLDAAFARLDEGATDREMWMEFPDLMLRYDKAFKRARIMRQDVADLTDRTLEDFNVNLEIDWSKSQLIWGPSGIGKTELAKALLPRALFVSHMDELTGFNEEYDGIIFDDMGFTHLPRTAQIHLTDQDNPRAIHVRYTVANIPAGTKKIFLSNTLQIFEWDPAIIRRVQVHHLENKLFD